jgi:LuxR family maltose regulon positive regulatory protein
MEILRLLSKGCSNRQMAEKLVLAEGTIKFHVHNLLGKLQVDSRTQAIARAKDLDLLK